MKFSKKEIKDLLIAWFFISLAFAIVFSGENTLSNPSLLLITFFISAFTAGIGFLLHEIMHKVLAQKYGLWAEFRAFYPMLFLALAFSFLGFIFAAPGAVFIEGRANKNINGKISIAGPWTNLIIGIIFLIPLLLISPTGITKLFFVYGFTINTMLGLFNLIPFPPFDGEKIINWNKTIYFMTVIIAIGLFILSFIVR